MSKYLSALFVIVMGLPAFGINQSVQQAILERNLPGIEQALPISQINEADCMLMRPLDFAVIAAESAAKGAAQAVRDWEVAFLAFEQAEQMPSGEEAALALRAAKSELKRAKLARNRAEQIRVASREIVLWLLRNGANPFAAYIHNPYISEENYDALSLQRRVRLADLLRGVEGGNEGAEAFLRDLLNDLNPVTNAPDATAAAAAAAAVDEAEPWNEHARLVEYLRAARRADGAEAQPLAPPLNAAPSTQATRRQGLLGSLRRAFSATSSLGFSGK